MKKLIAMSAIAAALSASAGQVEIRLNPSATSPIIPKEIYGHFSEHLGTCIYGGLWVGEDSPIPNTNGYRNDVLDALRDLHVPVLRWPGGCFADEYHWIDGIGPRESRPRMVNNNWGGTVEDNSFGTHEFFNLCELIGCEPYLSGNVGSGSVEELAKWVEYITAESGPMAERRMANGRQKPWKLKYLGVGNESWGCGGNFRVEYYADVYRRYQTYCRDYNGNHLFKIASGANAGDYNWTQVMMQQAKDQMHGISMHYYAVDDWSNHGSATKFTDDDYYKSLAICLVMDDIVKGHCRVMDEYDPQRKVALMVDEWGTWWDEEPGTIRGHLYQQNTMRDAMVAALTLNIFHRYTDRVKMANIAQIANVLQAMVLTKEDKMVLTPTYYVFKMYAAHQDAKFIPVTTDTPERTAMTGRPAVPAISATASEKDGKYTISVANTDLNEAQDITIDLSSIKAGKKVTGEILHAADIHDYNDFDAPDKVKSASFNKAVIKGGKLTFTIPAASIITLTL